MPVITYAYDLGQTVYNIDEDEGIRPAVVKKFEAEVMYGNTTLQYTIAFTKASEGSAVVTEDTLFTTADDAWAVYKDKYVE